MPGLKLGTGAAVTLLCAAGHAGDLSPGQRLDAVFADYNRRVAPGCAVGNLGRVRGLVFERATRE